MKINLDDLIDELTNILIHQIYKNMIIMKKVFELKSKNGYAFKNRIQNNN